MMQNSNNTDNCGCTDYAQYTAHTTIGQVYVANNYLDGSGTVQSLITGAANGTTVKSITIKATMPVTTGMIRFFVGSGSGIFSLYREVPIATTPMLASTPTPPLIMQTFEIALEGGLKLENNYTLYASTQNGEIFNIIVEGMDWAYNGTLPPGCCSFKQETAVTGFGNASVANTALDGSGIITPIFAAPTTGNPNGSLVKAITIKAQQSTNLGLIRFFISPAPIGPVYEWSLLREVCVPQTTQSGFEPSFKMVVDANLNITPGYCIGASTQVGQGFAFTVDGVSWLYPTY